MLIFLHGPDTFRSREQLKKMIAKFKADRDPQGFNVMVLDCAKEESGKIKELILASPFLSEKKLVALENPLSSNQPELQAWLLDRIEAKNLPEDTICLFWEAKENYKNKEAKQLSARLLKEKYAQKFDLLTGAKLTAWTAETIKARGGKISRPALDQLTRNTGADIWRLNSLIDQLLAYKNPPLPPFTKGGTRGVLAVSPLNKGGTRGDLKEIQIADVNLFLEEKIDDNIFNLVDAIMAGQAKAAYQMMREQYRLGKDPGYLFAMILRQFRILLQLRDLFERDDSPNSGQLAQKLNLHPFVVKKSLPFVKKYPLAELQRFYQILLDLDIKTKTGFANQSLLLDLFVAKTST